MIPATPCSKVSYETRRYAHTAAKRLKQRTGTTRIRPYRCPVEGGCGLWHVGHLPPPVVAGRMTANVFYGR